MQKWLSILAICASLGATAVSVWTYQNADARAEEALQRREKALVEKLKPEVVRAYQDAKIRHADDPQTLDELFLPLIRLYFQPLTR